MIAQPALTPAARPARRVPVGQRPGAMALAALGLALLLALGAVWMALEARQPATAQLAAPAAVAGPIVIPNHTTAGQIAFTIPLGAAQDQTDGGTPYIMPPTIRMTVGDKVIVTNDDVFPHIILSSLVMPGTTATMVFDEPGINAFSSGCTANGGTINAFTSVIVSERT